MEDRRSGVFAGDLEGFFYDERTGQLMENRAPPSGDCVTQTLPPCHSPRTVPAAFHSFRTIGWKPY